MPRLLIVSNRLPVTAREERGKMRLIPSPGGLATALRAPHERSDGRWFGWAGDLSGTSAAERADIEDQLRRFRTVPVQITAREIAHYYDRFSNGVLWPLLHYQIDKVNLDADRDWQVYKRVNRRFADAVAAEYRSGDLIWVHDYQLALVPGYLREVLPDARIGFFLHVPFPAADVFRILPWREEVLQGILGADVVGFHTSGYRHNFSHAAALILGLDMGVDALEVFGRRVRVGVYPISIDAAAFAQAAEKPEVLEDVRRLRAETAGKRIVLGIDRLDYTKGIPRRLLAIDRYLSRETQSHPLHFIQLAVPTRERVDAYSELRRSVNELVGRVNSHHGSPSGAPVHLLYRSVSFAELVALYRAADVMLVTPLRDGMNLVAKEYVASRTDDQGVLILSELAGAADELHGALSVNPYDLEQVASAIGEALDMGPEEQRLRMGSMRAQVQRADIHAWCRSFLEELEGPPTAPVEAPARLASAVTIAERTIEIQRAPARLLLLDYDGTLVPLAALPDLATPDGALLDLLRQLVEQPGTEVHVVSGRLRETLDRWLGALPIGLHAEHGLWSRVGSTWLPSGEPEVEWKPRIRHLFADTAARTPGALIEEKTAALTLHYRTCDPTLAGERLRELRPALERALRDGPAEILDGAKVIEVRQRGFDKGKIARRLLADLRPDAAVLAAGDDTTDEDMFDVLPASAVSIRVGPGKSRAMYRVDTPTELRAVLRRLLAGADVRRHSVAPAKDTRLLAG